MGFSDLQINGYPLKLKKSGDNIGHDAADVLVKGGALKQGELGIIGNVIATHSIHYFFQATLRSGKSLGLSVKTVARHRNQVLKSSRRILAMGWWY